MNRPTSSVNAEAEARTRTRRDRAPAFAEVTAGGRPGVGARAAETGVVAGRARPI
jgi:hypothetical protein